MEGTAGAFDIVMQVDGLLKPQTVCAYTQRVPVLNAVEKSIVAVVPLPVAVMPPVPVHTYVAAPVTAGTEYALPVLPGHPTVDPVMGVGRETVERIHLQAVFELPQAFPANTQTLQPEEPAGGSVVNVMVTDGDADA